MIERVFMFDFNCNRCFNGVDIFIICQQVYCYIYIKTKQYLNKCLCKGSREHKTLEEGISITH